MKTEGVVSKGNSQKKKPCDMDGSLVVMASISIHNGPAFHFQVQINVYVRVAVILISHC